MSTVTRPLLSIGELNHAPSILKPSTWQVTVGVTVQPGTSKPSAMTEIM